MGLVHSGKIQKISIAMSLLKSIKSASILGRQCMKIASSSHIQNNSYAQMAFTFASPRDVFYNNADVKQIDVPSFSGNFGILPDHVPLLAVLQPGVVTVTEADSSAKKYFVSSGSVTINDDSSVQILAEEACTVDSLDRSAIQEGLSKANTDFADLKGTEESKAEARIAVECYEAMLKAVE